MAKKQKKERATEPSERSVLENAFLAYAQGDMVTARKGARMVMDAPQPADEAFAKQTGAEQMFVGKSEAGAKEVATELHRRTGVFPKAYALGGLAAAIYLLMLFIASRY